MKAVPLREAAEEGRFGGKAVALGAALRAGLRVPGGIALEAVVVEAMASGAEALPGLLALLQAEGHGGPWAVRSSAVGEDSGASSFAGQHLTRLNVTGGEALLAAVREVRDSGRTPGALAYREKLGLSGEPRVGVVVQSLVRAETSGVLFTRNPMTGADERVVEVSYGLGEAVVSGLVTPDRWRLGRDGQVIEAALGEKDLEILPHGDGTREAEVDPERAARFCLDRRQLSELGGLARACEEHFQGPSDIEFAFAGGLLYLLQRRPVTR